MRHLSCTRCEPKGSRHKQPGDNRGVCVDGLTLAPAAAVRYDLAVPPAPDKPGPPKAVVNIQVSDVDPLTRFFGRLVKLHDRLERGEILTVDEARDELGRILTLNEGERLG